MLAPPASDDDEMLARAARARWNGAFAIDAIRIQMNVCALPRKREGRRERRSGNGTYIVDVGRVSEED